MFGHGCGQGFSIDPGNLVTDAFVISRILAQFIKASPTTSFSPEFKG